MSRSAFSRFFAERSSRFRVCSPYPAPASFPDRVSDFRFDDR